MLLRPSFHTVRKESENSTAEPNASLFEPDSEFQHLPYFPGPVWALALTSALMFRAAELLKGWLDQGPSLDPSWIHRADLDEQCVRLLSQLHSKAFHLLSSYLHRLLIAGALPPGNLSRLLEFLGRDAELQFSGLGPPAGQILGWINAAPTNTFNQYPAWRVETISGGMVARFGSWAPDGQRMLFLDLQLRCLLGTLFLVPVYERGRFF